MKFLFSPYGRTDRKGFWLFILVYIALTVGSVQTDQVAGTYYEVSQIGLFETLMAIFLFWPSIAVPVSRLHDLGFSGWWILWVPLISAAIFVIVLLTIGMFVGIVDLGLDSIIYTDDQINLESVPVFLWVILGLSSAPYLIQLFMLAFLPSEKGENQFDRVEDNQKTPKTDTPPWAV